MKSQVVKVHIRPVEVTVPGNFNDQPSEKLLLPPETTPSKTVWSTMTTRIETETSIKRWSTPIVKTEEGQPPGPDYLFNRAHGRIAFCIDLISSSQIPYLCFTSSYSKLTMECFCLHNKLFFYIISTENVLSLCPFHAANGSLFIYSLTVIVRICPLLYDDLCVYDLFIGYILSLWHFEDCIPSGEWISDSKKRRKQRT
uniref:Uncharacterized protein n=1 Tax=Heterorhabditis bacteriophora TaxID=37862 RepID=A0A1I7XSS3_HETBA